MPSIEFQDFLGGPSWLPFFASKSLTALNCIYKGFLQSNMHYIADICTFTVSQVQ